jgi:hypothetical protein
MIALLAFHDRATGFRYDLSPSNDLRNLAAYLLAFFNPLVWPLDDWVMPPSVRTTASWRVMQAGIAALLAMCLVSFARVASRGRIVAFGRLVRHRHPPRGNLRGSLVHAVWLLRLRWTVDRRGRRRRAGWRGDPKLAARARRPRAGGGPIRRC